MDAKPIKIRPYHLNSKYKEKVHLQLDKMLEAGIIEPLDESDWVSPMVLQEKKRKKDRYGFLQILGSLVMPMFMMLIYR